MNRLSKKLTKIHKRRLFEFEETVTYFPENSKSLSILEIDIGTEYQLKMLKNYFERKKKM